MAGPKRQHPETKSRIHPRSKHRNRYNFKKLIASHSELADFVKPNKYGDDSIEFSDAEAVKALNKALLKIHYRIKAWDVPKGYLCPPIPSRADYIHHIADVLRESNYGIIPEGGHIVCLDIGVGANCVYPIIGTSEYCWSFIGSDIDKAALNNAQSIVDTNPELRDKVELRLQLNRKDVLYGVIRVEDRIDLTICNPPFHSSQEEAAAGTNRKNRNLKTRKSENNFGGKNTELWCDGGEKKFIRNLVHESRKFSDSCFWFSTLVSKQSNLKSLYGALNTADAFEVKTIAMGQGNKTSRIVAWTFLKPHQQRTWRETRWN
ncbi:23S rRNA (adenine(1618)-N(6))-methyltransferase RlmF [Flavobacteriales bacterium]|nr:23S rRNA (adenine(1618)-N(6))-methyltransferase RlmF [Flavobacteriales bacterium]